MTEDRAEAMRRSRDDYARRQVEQAEGGFPVYPLPEFVRERFPTLDLADPSTWPEPDRCTEGRPWGHDAYADVWTRPEGRWESYLVGRLARPCRNRWRDERTRLCGVHLRPFVERIADARRRVATREREHLHLDLAKRLGTYGIVAEGRATGVVLDAENTTALLRILAEADRIAPL